MATNPGSRIVTKLVLPVGDMERAVGFYRNLGFDVESFSPTYAWVTNGGDEVLHLALAEEFAATENRAAGYLHVQDAAAWHQAWTGRVETSDLIDQPWGMREFSFRDPDNNFLRVGQNL